MNQAVVIYSGNNMRAVVAFCREARRLQIPFHTLAASSEDPIFDTQYADSVFATRSSRKLCIEETLKWFEGIRNSNNYDQLVVLPTSEFLNRFLLEHQPQLELNAAVVPLVETEDYNKISDKWSFTRLCEEHGLAVPQEFELLPSTLPFVAKPTAYASAASGKQLKPWLITSPSLLERFKQEEQIEEFFFQELAEGKSIYLLYFVSKSDKDVLFSQENLIQQCNGGSIILARQSSAHENPIALQYLQMFKQIGFHGVVMVELKETVDGPVMIEANPRFWGPMQFVVDNGIPIITQFLRERGFAVEADVDCGPGTSEKNAEYYFWSGGISKTARPLILHNYTEKQFLVEYPELIEHDVFLRDDTINLYASEFRNET